jgi:hypothetical protein
VRNDEYYKNSRTIREKDMGQVEGEGRICRGQQLQGLKVWMIKQSCIYWRTGLPRLPGSIATLMFANSDLIFNIISIS